MNEAVPEPSLEEPDWLGARGPLARRCAGALRQVVETRGPIYDDKPFVSTDGRWISDETLFLPLSEDGTRIDRILVAAASAPYKKQRF